LQIAAPGGNEDEQLAVHKALDRLATHDAHKAELVKLRYFVGMTIEQAAEALGISENSQPLSTKNLFSLESCESQVRGYRLLTARYLPANPLIRPQVKQRTRQVIIRPVGKLYDFGSTPS